MKFEIHSSMMNNVITSFFYKCIENFANEYEKIDPKAKKIQCYSDYFLSDGSYPFMNEEHVYYPLTIIYGRGNWKILWIFWERNDSILSLKQIPFSILKEIEVSICTCVPQAFQEYVKDKKLAFFQNREFAAPVIHTIHSLETIGTINQNFVDVMSERISEILTALSGRTLNPHWSLEIYDTDSTYTINGKKHRVVHLKTWHAHCIQLGLCWDGDYDVCDYIVDSDIHLALTDEPFDKRVASFPDIILFMKNGGFMF